MTTNARNQLPNSGNEKEGEVERVYRLIKSWLIEGKLQPGEFLSEVGLARACRTSRTPIREACNRLAQDKWIQRIRQKGYLVPAVSVREIVEIYEYRKLLECFNAESVAHTARSDQIKELQEITKLEHQRRVDLKDVLAANEVFHIRLAEMAGNQRVLAQLKLTLESVRRLDHLSAQKDSTWWLPHGEIVSSLAGRKPATARRAMAAHIEHSRDRMLKLFGS